MDVTAELRRLRPHWERHWPTADLDAIASDGAARLHRAVDAWELSDDLAFLPGGVVALVAADADRVLKVVPRGTGEDANLVAEGIALGWWAAAGLSPTIRARRDDGLTLLMDRVRPGVALDELDPAPTPGRRLDLIADLTRRMHAASPAEPVGLAHISTALPFWRATMADDPAELDALLAPTPADVVVHADLHGGNVLRAADGWRVIDPHAMVGDRHLDVWALIDPSLVGLDPGATRDRVARFAARAGLDRDRAGRWLRMWATIEARDIAATPSPTEEDREWAAWLRAVAQELTEPDDAVSARGSARPPSPAR